MAKEIKILGFNFTKLKAEKNPNFEGKLELNSNMNISSVDKHRMDLIKEDALKISFDFLISYKELGKVEISGIMFLMVDNKTLKEAIKLWEDKKFPEELKTAVLNLIMQKCSLKAFELEEDLGLPLHMPMPRLQSREEKN